MRVPNLMLTNLLGGRLCFYFNIFYDSVLTKDGYTVGYFHNYLHLIVINIIVKFYIGYRIVVAMTLTNESAYRYSGSALNISTWWRFLIVLVQHDNTKIGIVCQ